MASYGIEAAGRNAGGWPQYAYREFGRVLELAPAGAGAGRRNLVFASVGDRWALEAGLRAAAAAGRGRPFDVCVVHYGDEPGKFRDLASPGMYLERKGFKYGNFLFAYETLPALHGYDAVWLADDDIALELSGVERMFDALHGHGLWIAQPAYAAGSDVSHGLTARRPGQALRFTNFVEVGAPFFSRTALLAALGTFFESETGAGLDYVWWTALGQPADKLAVVDAVPCRHPFPAAA